MSEPSVLPILWYFADPMCSWCWGFSPVIARLKENYGNQLKIALVMGGLQPGTTEVMPGKSRQEILHHWRQVEQKTAQKFNFDNALPEGLIYDTEPACRAVITVAQMDSSKTFDYFTAVQSAFYLKNLDVTQSSCLQQIAEESGLDGADFSTRFESEEMLINTKRNFQFSRKAGVQGFPTLILNQGETLHVLTRGFQDYSLLASRLDNLLAESGGMA